jgi:hypothetical protein
MHCAGFIRDAGQICIVWAALNKVSAAPEQESAGKTNTPIFDI